MADYEAMLQEAKAELKRATESLAIWEGYGPTTVTDEKGKEVDLRSQSIARCKWNMQKTRQMIEAIEKRLGKSN